MPVYRYIYIYVYIFVFAVNMVSVRSESASTIHTLSVQSTIRDATTQYNIIASRQVRLAMLHIYKWIYADRSDGHYDNTKYICSQGTGKHHHILCTDMYVVCKERRQRYGEIVANMQNFETRTQQCVVFGV